MDDQLKDYLDTKFENVYQRIDSINESFNKDITELRKNDDQHFYLDRDHRETCANKRNALVQNVEDTLSRFGERIGKLETEHGKLEERVDTVKTDLQNGIAEIKEAVNGSRNQLQEWMRTLTPYLIMAIGVLYTLIK